MTTEREYEERIKAIVKEAMAEGVVWTEKQFGQISAEAIREVADKTAREMYGGGR